MRLHLFISNLQREAGSPFKASGRISLFPQQQATSLEEKYFVQELFT